MIRMGSNSIAFACLIVVFGFSLAALIAAPAHSEDQWIPVTEPSPGKPPCEEFYDEMGECLPAHATPHSSHRQASA